MFYIRSIFCSLFTVRQYVILKFNDGRLLTSVTPQTDTKASIVNKYSYDRQFIRLSRQVNASRNKVVTNSETKF